jgi:protein-export membrane protein SecD
MELGLDLAGGVDLLYRVKPAGTGGAIDELTQRARDVVADRVDALGVAGSAVHVQGDHRDQIRVLVPTADPHTQKNVKESVGLTSLLAFHEVVDSGRSVADLDTGAADTIALSGARGEHYLLKKTPELTGEDLAEARVGHGDLGEPEIEFTFTDDGARKSGEITSRLKGRQLAIVVGGRVQMAPVIETRIEQHGRIRGGMDVGAATRAVRMLRAGSLPAELEMISETVIGPTLGADTVHRGLVACGAGAGLVVLFMVWLYRLAGVVATAALALNLVLQLAVLAAFGATLTLPGIAGLALTAGIAVDSNVLVFERIRDERRAGKSIKAALAAGYEKALPAILDSHATSFLTAAILYGFGSGPVKGFAVTLGIGLLANLFTATWASRTVQELAPEHTTVSLA